MDDRVKQRPAEDHQLDLRRRLLSSLAVREVLTRLDSRKWLVAMICCTFLLLMFFSGLAPEHGLAALAFVLAAVALIPEQLRTDREFDSSIAETTRQRALGSFRNFVDAIPDAAILLTRDGTIVNFNRAAADLVPNLQRQLNIATIVRNPDFLDIVSGAPMADEIMRIDYAERVPVERRIEATAAALKWGGSGHARPAILVTLRDLTEQDGLTRMRSDFISYASHELRTPLASVIGFIETLKGPARDDPEARNRILDIMAVEAERMTRLINDLLSLSRVEMNQHVLPRGIVEINGIANHVAASMEPIANEREIAIDVMLSEGDAFVRGDQDDLVRVLQNLIQNAIKYGRDGGKIIVRVARVLPNKSPGVSEPGRIAISVIDDGPGIPEKHLPRLTERFYRADVEKSRERGGTGLGLAIVKHVVNRHRGLLSVQSKIGKGSSFTVVLNELDKKTSTSSVK